MQAQEHSFKQRIDLWDETLREGAERATTSSTVEEKVEIAISLSDIGVKTIVVGMFPEVPASYNLLKSLLQKQHDGKIKEDVRFIVISHVGNTAEKTKRELQSLGFPLERVWLMLIHSVSDQQITHMFPIIANSYSNNSFNTDDWDHLDVESQKELNVEWLDNFLSDFKSPEGLGGLVLGMLDYFRADVRHIKNVATVGHKHGIRNMRMVDTAGTCTPQQIPAYVDDVVSMFPDINFFGHFHNDFGLATANAILGLTRGLKGVDVSVGGFANRAGHPPLAEVVMSLRDLYDYEIEGFKYSNLFALSRLVEKIYCLVETPTQPITGVITHSVTSGIRTQLIKKCATIFDVIKPEDVGADLKAMFGIRSGIDGIRRLIKLYDLDPNERLSPQDIESLYSSINDKWVRQSKETKERLSRLIADLNDEILKTSLPESEVINYIREEIVEKETHHELA